MLTEQTIEKMNAMKLYAMAKAFTEQLASVQYNELAFAERLGLLVDTEYTTRENRKLTRRLRAAKMRYAASVEDVDFRAPRALDRAHFLSLATCAWLQERHNLILTGPTGIGKSYLACALTERACRRGFTAYYVRAPRLLDELTVSRVDGSWPRVLARLGKLDLLSIDDWLLAPLKDPERRMLMEVIEERSERGSTLIATQLPIKDWHGVIGDPNHADALLDRLLHNAHRIELSGRSMRKTKNPPKTTKTKDTNEEERNES